MIEQGQLSDNLASLQVRDHILNLLPQVPPFRFIDQITELSTNHIVATYHFTGKEWFYAGHFPGDPVTPGVILLEAMAQAGLVALGIYLMRMDNNNQELRTLFSECDVEFLNVVRPGERIVISAEKVYWRKNKLNSEVELRNQSNELVACGVLSGLGVARR